MLNALEYSNKYLSNTVVYKSIQMTLAAVFLYFDQCEVPYRIKHIILILYI